MQGQQGGGSCFDGDGMVAVGENGTETERTDRLRAGSRVYSPTLQREVTVVATTFSYELELYSVNGLLITSKHPIKMDLASDWVLPGDVAEQRQPARPTMVYNFVVSEGATMLVNNVTVLTLGEDFHGSDRLWSPSARDFFATSKVIDALRLMPSWPDCNLTRINVDAAYRTMLGWPRRDL